MPRGVLILLVLIKTANTKLLGFSFGTFEAFAASRNDYNFAIYFGQVSLGRHATTFLNRPFLRQRGYIFCGIFIDNVYNLAMDE
jgi:hypothetical protein